MGLFSKIKAVFTPAEEQWNDPVLGKLCRDASGIWMGELPFAHAPTGAGTIGLLIDAGEGKPTAAQQELYQEVVRRYGELWPEIAAALARTHPELTTAEAVTQHISEPSLYLPELVQGAPREWSLDYVFDLETEGDMSYGVEFTEWTLVEVSAGD